MQDTGLIFICFCCGLSAGIIGKYKRSSFWLWFAIGFFLPLLGTLAALLWRFEDNEPHRECPECGNVVPLYQQVCNHCGRDLEWPSELDQEVPSAAG
jgi:endogenous inhibitor of DNA gyrase (YacG/DUF329 family)